MQKIIPFAYKVILPLAVCMLLAAGCVSEEEEARVELADPIGGSSIVTGADLLAFLERGESNTATLSGDISLEQEMLRITKERDGLVINGNGFTLSGAGDCVIRLEDGCSVTLNDVVLHSGADAIGCLGDASIGGSGLSIVGLGNGIRAAGTVTIRSGSSIQSTATNGTGLIAAGLVVENGANIIGQGPLGGGDIAGSILLEEGASLGAFTQENYNALKCDGTLTMLDGSSLTAENSGQYHGAEIRDLSVSGMVTIEAVGGDNSSGLFLFEQLNSITVLGHCTPAPRFESGKGSIEFVEDPADFPNEDELTQTPAPQEAEQQTEE